MEFKDSTIEQVDEAVRSSWKAFEMYKDYTLAERTSLMNAIARELEKESENLVLVAGNETHLDPARLHIELRRTIFQLESYGAACKNGAWLGARIDTRDKQRIPAKPDLRKM